jgi:hypothetical protein
MSPERPRSAMPLPRYVERRWHRREQKWGYLFNAPTWAKNVAADDQRGPCPVQSEALGTDHVSAVERAEKILLPQLDAWRTGGPSAIASRGPSRGTFDWMAGLFRGSPQYAKLSGRQQANYEYGLRVASNHRLKENPRRLIRFGELRLSDIAPGVVDKLYAAIKADREPVPDETGEPTLDRSGNPVIRETPRLRRAQEAMKASRRAWNVARRMEPGDVPHANPFEKAEVEAPKTGRTVPATWDQTLTFVKACDQHGDWSIGTAAMVSFLWFQRQEHIVGVPRDDGRITGLLWADYRPKENPTCVVIQHPKTHETVRLPLEARLAHLHTRQARRDWRPSPMGYSRFDGSSGCVHPACKGDQGRRRPSEGDHVPVVPPRWLYCGRRRGPVRRRCQRGRREDGRDARHLSEGHDGAAAARAHAIARSENAGLRRWWRDGYRGRQLRWPLGYQARSDLPLPRLFSARYWRSSSAVSACSSRWPPSFNIVSASFGSRRCFGSLTRVLAASMTAGVTSGSSRRMASIARIRPSNSSLLMFRSSLLPSDIGANLLESNPSSGPLNRPALLAGNRIKSRTFVHLRWKMLSTWRPSPSANALKTLERVKGIEPSSSAWKAVALPLSYTRELACSRSHESPPLPTAVARAGFGERRIGR